VLHEVVVEQDVADAHDRRVERHVGAHLVHGRVLLVSTQVRVVLYDI
jgi:hypothetical protein